MGMFARRRLMGAVGVLAASAGRARSQPNPLPPPLIRILVGFSAGGGTDVITRMLAQQLSGGPLGMVVVENKAGASGLIAAEVLAKGPSNGSVLMVASQTTLCVAPILYKSATFNAPRDVAGVAMLGASPLVLVANPKFEAATLAQLIALAKAKPGTVNYGSGGVGTTPHMAAELFLFNAGIRMTHVGYRGEAPAIADVLAGQLPLVFANVSVVTGQVRSGALRALAVTSPERAPGLPEVPTLRESGIQGSDVETWFGLTAPAATPRETIRQMNAEVLKALAAPDLVQRFAELSLRVWPSAPEELDAIIKAESARWSEVIQRAGIKAAE